MSQALSPALSQAVGPGVGPALNGALSRALSHALTRARRRALSHTLCGLGLAASVASAHALPTFDEVRAAHRPSDIALLDRHGTVIHWHRADTAVRRGPWVALADVSPALREAIVLSEDRRFWAHGGVDWRALAASAWANAWNTRTRGASTVTMQLAGLLDDSLARPAGGRDVPTKVAQIVRAQALEARWSKAQILEAYLNAVPLRGELVGVAAASQQLFGKHPSGLGLQEAAILAVLVRAPNAAAEAVSRRACEVLKQQVLEPRAAEPQAPADPAAACAGVATTAAQALARRPGPMLGEALAPHLARTMWRQAQEPGEPGEPAERGRGRGRAAAGALAGASASSAAAPHSPPGTLRSTLDARIQRLAREALRRQLAELRGREVEDGAVLVLDNASGEVLAWVGSAGSHSTAAEVDAVLARRQPGSTIKPFVYALALERRLITAASLIDDAPVQLEAGAAGLYTPRNYDHAWRGAVSVREALAGSLNVPAVRVAAMLGPEAIFERLVAAGLQPAHHAGHHGHALALGSADVTLLDLTNAYRTLAQGGRWTPVRWSPARLGTAARASGGTGEGTLPAARQVFSPEAAWLVSNILADPAARAASFGFDSPLVTRGHAAVKTGTSKDMRDNWCIGSTERFTVGVWVGNASGRPMHHVSGVAGAAPVWRELVAALHAGSPSRERAAPAGLAAVGGEWFIEGTAPPPGVPGVPGAAGAPGVPGPGTRAARAAPFGIEAPRAGTVIALDPEMPWAAQRLVIRGAPGRWALDGQPLGQGARFEWLPTPGRHVLERREGEVHDRIEFEVRASPASTRAAAGRAAPRAAAAASAAASPAAPTPPGG